MARQAGAKRTQVSCSLPPELADRLAKESDARLISSAKIIEIALTRLFEGFDEVAMIDDSDNIRPIGA